MRRLRYYASVARIRLRYCRRRVQIEVRMHSRLARISVAGVLVRAAFRISGDLMQQMGYRR